MIQKTKMCDFFLVNKSKSGSIYTTANSFFVHKLIFEPEKGERIEGWFSWVRVDENPFWDFSTNDVSATGIHFEINLHSARIFY